MEWWSGGVVECAEIEFDIVFTTTNTNTSSWLARLRACRVLVQAP
jgi:hypothetical protein